MNPLPQEVRANDQFQKIKSKLYQYIEQITWQNVYNTFISESKEELPNSTIKAGKALCFAMQLYLRDEEYKSRKALSKIHQIGPYLQTHRAFIDNLKQNVYDFQ